MSEDGKKCVLVAGVTGVVGRRVAEHFASLPGWDVVGLSRRLPLHTTSFRCVQVDLNDAADCRAKLAPLKEVTHVVYAARYDHSTTAPEPVDINTAMLRNLVEAIEPVAQGLRHVHLVEGSKYYGSTLGAYPTPAREDDPRVLQACFYYDQEDYLFPRQAGRPWSWSVSRPHGICDHAPGVARSMAMVIGVYAAISRELGLPLDFPGTPANFGAMYQCTDAGLLARSIAWMSTEPRCANQAFNITNGDYIRWCNLWPAFARHFGMEPGRVRTIRLAATMPSLGPVWDRVVRRHGLVQTPYDKVALWPYGDFLFHPGWDIMSDTLKARRFGFHDAVDTGTMFLGLFDHFRREGVLP